MADQYHLFKTTQEIDTFQSLHRLIKVDATPTNAAMQPGWPQGLWIFLLSIGIVVWSYRPWGVKPPPALQCLLNLLPGVFFDLFLPVVLAIWWLIGFITAELRYSTGGWISANLTNTGGIIATAMAWAISEDSMLISFGLVALGVVEFIGTLVIVIQRCKTSSGFGIIAYNITDMHGCVPGSVEYLQRGARSPIFRYLQLGETLLSLVIVVIVYMKFDSAYDFRGPIHLRRRLKEIERSSRAEETPRVTLQVSPVKQLQPPSAAATPTETIDVERGTPDSPTRQPKTATKTGAEDEKREANPHPSVSFRPTARGGGMSPICVLPFILLSAFGQIFSTLLGAVRKIPARRLGAGSIIVCLPGLIYTSAISTHGMPVVVSGNCMLVETSPRFGFYDARIETWWVVIVGFVGA